MAGNDRAARAEFMTCASSNGKHGKRHECTTVPRSLRRRLLGSTTDRGVEQLITATLEAGEERREDCAPKGSGEYGRSRARAQVVKNPRLGPDPIIADDSLRRSPKFADPDASSCTRRAGSVATRSIIRGADARMFF